MKGVQCYELFGGIALKNHAFIIIIIKATCLDRVAIDITGKRAGVVR